MAATTAHRETDFVITVGTTSGSPNFAIPTYSGEANYNVDCDNDGVNEVTPARPGTPPVTTPPPTTYTGGNIEENTGLGTGFPRIYFNGVYGPFSDAQKLLTIEQWGKGKWTSIRNAAFAGCTNLAGQGAGRQPRSLRRHWNMSDMFDGAAAFNQDISTWNTAQRDQT